MYAAHLDVSAMVILFPTLTGCMHGEVSPLSPRRLIEQSRPAGLRVTLREEPMVVVARPTGRGDSVAVIPGECLRLPERRVGYLCPPRPVVALADPTPATARYPAEGSNGASDPGTTSHSATMRFGTQQSQAMAG